MPDKDLRVEHVLTVTSCIVCGVQFALPADLVEYRQEHGGYYHCPNGHQQGWEGKEKDEEGEEWKHKGESDATREARREIARKIHEQDQAEAKAAEQAASAPPIVPPS